MGKNDKHTPDHGKGHREKWFKRTTKAGSASPTMRGSRSASGDIKSPPNASPSEVDHEARLEELEQQKWEQDNDE